MAQSVKNLPAMQETWLPSPGREDPLEKGMATPPVFLPGEFHGQRSLAGYSPWGHNSRTRLTKPPPPEYQVLSGKMDLKFLTGKLNYHTLKPPAPQCWSLAITA